MTIAKDERLALERGEHAEPHRILGMRHHEEGGEKGLLVRAFHPVAIGVQCLLPTGDELEMERDGEGGIFRIFNDRRRDDWFADGVYD